MAKKRRFAVQSFDGTVKKMPIGRETGAYFLALSGEFMVQYTETYDHTR